MAEEGNAVRRTDDGLNKNAARAPAGPFPCLLAIAAVCCMAAILPAAAHAASEPPPLGHATGGAGRAGTPCGVPQMPHGAHPACAPEAKSRVPGDVGRIPSLPLFHQTSLSVSHYPAVGEVANVTLTVTFNASMHALLEGAVAAAADRGNPPPGPHIANITSKYRIFDVVSNMGSGDPSAFVPYDPGASTLVPKDGATYVVKAKFVIVKDAFAVIEGIGFDGDRVSLTVAAAGNMSMPYDEYARAGQTYLDHITGGANAADPWQGARLPELAGAVGLGERMAGQGSVQGRQQQPAPLFEIMGTLRAKGYFSSPDYIAARGMQVCAYDYSPSSTYLGGFTPLRDSSGARACTFTDSEGRYRVSNITNRDPTDDTRADLAVRAASTGPNSLKVRGTNGFPYVQTLYYAPDFEGTLVNITSDLGSANSGAARIINTIMEGRDFFVGHGIWHNPLIIKWQHGSPSSAFADRTAAGGAYSWFYNIMWLDGGGSSSTDDSQQKWVVLHEFGHHIADVAGRREPYSCGSVHYIGRPNTVGCAWQEGWADFVPHLVTNMSRIKHAHVYINLEQARLEFSSGASLAFARYGAGGADVGHTVEGRVAAALWDIKDDNVDGVHDSAAGGRDDLALGDDEIVRVFKAESYRSFEGFANKWQADNPLHSSRNIMALHSMGFAGSLHETPRHVTRVDSAAADGAYAAGREIDIGVHFDGAVRVAGPLELRLNSGGTAPYASGSGTGTLTFRYAVEPGENAADLEYAGAGALSGAGAITDAATGAAANRTLPLPGTGRSLGDLKDIRIDTAAPRVLAVEASTPDGAYGAGRRIDVAVVFDEPVLYRDAPPSLALNISGLPRAAPYASGNGTASLNFSYVVRPGDSSADLGYYNATALAGNVTDGAGNAAGLALPARASGASLSGASSIRIDTVPPSVVSVASPNRTGTYHAHQWIYIAVVFDETVRVAAGAPPPFIGLNSSDGARAVYESGSGTGALAFAYAVRPGDAAAALDYAGSAALRLGGGAVVDAAGNAANLTLPPPGSAGSLASASAADAGIAIDTSGAYVDNVTSPDAAAVYAAGARINITVSFSEPVRVAAGAPPPSIELNAGPGARAVYESGSGTGALAFAYVVRAGDNVDGLGYARGAAVLPNGGMITAAAGGAAPAALYLPPPRGPESLSGSTSIAVDAAAPAVERISSPNATGAYGIGDAIHVHVGFSENVTVDGAPLLALEAGAAGQVPAAYVSGSGTPGLLFLYTVAPGDRLPGGVPGLPYPLPWALSLGAGGSGAVYDRAGNAANLTLPPPPPPTPPGARGSPAAWPALYVDGAPPAVERVSSPNATGAYGIGDAIHVHVGFSENVTVDGAPLLALEAGAAGQVPAAYVSGSGTPGLLFLYTVAPGDRLPGGVPGLPYPLPWALSLGAGGSGAVYDRAGNAANLTLPPPPPPTPPGARGSPAAWPALYVDGAPPAVERVSSPNATGAYGIGDAIHVHVGFSENVTVDGAPPLLALPVGVPPLVPAAYVSGSGTPSLLFLYTVAPGDRSPGLPYPLPWALSLGAGGSGAVYDRAGNAADLTLPPPPTPSGARGSPAAWPALYVDGAPPAVERVSSPNATGAYGIGDTIHVRVEFSENVTVDGAPPSLALNVSGLPRAAPYASGNGTASLVFSYVVRPGDSSADLGYYNATALAGNVTDRAGNAADLTLPAPGSPGSLARAGSIAVDTAAPRVLGVEPATPDGAYGAGRRIDVAVVFDEPVLYRGAPPSLALNVSGLPRAAPYASGNGTASLVFSYVVRPGDSSADLGYYNATALAGNVTDGAGHAADLALPAPGSPGSLAHAGSIAVDTAVPRVLRVEPTTPDGAYGPGTSIGIAVVFDDAVRVSEPLTLRLSSGGTAEYASANSDAELAFTYTVRQGDGAGDLDTAGAGALSRSGAIADAATGAAANLTLPAPGSPGSLARAGSIAVDTAAPRVLGVEPATPDGAYGIGATIEVHVLFTEPVSVAGEPLLALNAGPPAGGGRHARYAPGGIGADAFADALPFLYTVQPGDSADSLGYAGISALDIGGGAIVDRAGNAADLALPAPGSPGSLARAGSIAVDTAAPRVLGVEPATPDGAYGIGATIEVHVLFTEPVSVAGEPLLALNAGPPAGGGRHARYAPGGIGADAFADALPFLYIVQPGDSADSLGYAGISALDIGGGAIVDRAGNAADLALPAPGSPGSLDYASNISVQGGVSGDSGTSNRTAAAATATADAAFIGKNTVRITYSSSLAPPAGYAGPVYGAITVAGGGGGGTAMPVFGGVTGLGTAVHTVKFGGGGVTADQTGTIALSTRLEGAAADGTPQEFTDGAIEVHAGATVRTVRPAGPMPVVPIERDGFVREVNVADGGDSVRPAINITGLYVAPPGQGAAEGGAATFPGGPRTSIVAPFAEVSFPPRVNATPVPAGGLLELYVSDRHPPVARVAEALNVSAASVELQRVVEVGDSAAHIAFDMPVRVLLGGQAGGRAFYVNNTDDAVVPIDAACAADDTAAAHALLNGAGECWLDLAGGDKAVYTYHLTRFGTASAPTRLEAMVAGAAEWWRPHPRRRRRRPPPPPPPPGPSSYAALYSRARLARRAAAAGTGTPPRSPSSRPRRAPPAPRCRLRSRATRSAARAARPLGPRRRPTAAAAATAAGRRRRRLKG